MSKIVQAVNAMISNPDNISAVVKGESELFFRYKGKYTWSMRRNENGLHYLYFYPDGDDVDDLARREVAGDAWGDVNMVVYNDGEIGTREAKASFSELFTLLKECVFGVNKVLDEIIADGESL